MYYNLKGDERIQKSLIIVREKSALLFFIFLLTAYATDGKIRQNYDVYVVCLRINYARLLLNFHVIVLQLWSS